MNEYMLSVFGISLILGVLETVKYKKGGGERLAFAVLLAFTVISPLEGLLNSDVGSFPVYSPEGLPDDAVYEEKAREAFEEGVTYEISDKFDIEREKISVRAFGFSFEEMRAEKITVTLSVKAAGADPKRIKKHIEKLCEECEVGFEIG